MTGPGETMKDEAVELWIGDADHVDWRFPNRRMVSTPEEMVLLQHDHRNVQVWEGRRGTGLALTPGGLLEASLGVVPNPPRLTRTVDGSLVTVTSTTSDERAEALYGPTFELRTFTHRFGSGGALELRVTSDEAHADPPEDAFQIVPPAGYELVRDP